MTSRLERRIVPGSCELRAKQTGGFVFTGYAAVFYRYSQNLGGFVEQVASGAFAKTIDEADIRGLFNHDANWILGRNQANTLRLAEDKTGLHYEIDAPDTQTARDLAVSIERGDITGSSFGFNTLDDDWGFTEQDFPLRTLIEVRLFDVGPVTFPAYLDSEADLVRGAVRSLAESTGRPLDELVAAASAGELRSLMAKTPEDATPAAQPEQHSTGGDPLAVYRHRLDLIERTRGR